MVMRSPRDKAMPCVLERMRQLPGRQHTFTLTWWCRAVLCACQLAVWQLLDGDVRERILNFTLSLWCPID